MVSTEPLITDVSDTARWAAAYRAIESSRKDALFCDPFADRMAGPSGYEIINAAPRKMRTGLGVVVRTKIIDDLIQDALAHGCRKVLNLAAGLDTRPYRLDLSPELVWVEADLPRLLAEKERLLADEVPTCRLQRHTVDLSDAEAMRSFLAAEVTSPANTLVITEGLVQYLDDDQVGELSSALREANVNWWIVDVMNATMQNAMEKSCGTLFANAPFRFVSDDPIAHFEERGWTATDVESVYMTARKANRLPWHLKALAPLLEPDPRNTGGRPWGGVLRLSPS
ncbi:class I SAM-dependent methyltransferase [Nocardia altamirensis]|uniref:class I SAM-dependent methyltransferase n=1 Tax=Nocardia altamirensis TaxID=472158 RepID=UPI000840742A|nr:SAM-dependent methyltransferase [Nocardia altamirensis]